MPTNHQCSCKTLKNSQCSFSARASKKYCGHHEPCKRPISLPRGPMKKKPSAENAQKVEEPTSFSPPTDLKCEGYWNNDTYNPQLMVSKVEWPSKHLFLVHVKAIEDRLIYEAEEMWDKKKKFSERYVMYRGFSTSVMDKSQLGSSEFQCRDSAGKLICWPTMYASHYIGKYNIMPTKRFFTFIEATYPTFPRKPTKKDKNSQKQSKTVKKQSR